MSEPPGLASLQGEWRPFVLYRLFHINIDDRLLYVEKIKIVVENFFWNNSYLYLCKRVHLSISPRIERRKSENA